MVMLNEREIDGVISNKLKEDVITTKNIFEGSTLKLRVDTVKLPNNKTHEREIVDHPGSVAIVPQLEDGRIVLVKQYRQPAKVVTVEIPAGTITTKEEPDDCACRELIEETGYIAGRLKKLFSCYTAPGYSSEKIHIYHASKLKKTVRRPDTDEFISLLYVDLSKAVDMIKDGEIEDCKTMCGIFGVLHPGIL